MKSEHRILAAFILNLLFAAFEFAGGAFTGSVAILSDAVHDLGDAVGIGVSYVLERRSRRRPDATYTYGYARWSVIGSALVTLILLVGSVVVITQAIDRIVHPVAVHSEGMIVLAVIGVVVNLAAALITREGGSVNQKAVNLHMLEDVLGWLAVLVGGVVMRFTGWTILDPLLSIGVALFIFVSAVKHFKETLDPLLEKVPHGVSVEALEDHLKEIDGVCGVHHMHVWSMDGRSHCATVHVVAAEPAAEIKQRVREELKEHGIGHVTVELERAGETCGEEECHPEPITAHHHHHHHGHSH